MESLSELTHLTGDERRQIAIGAASVFERTAFALAGKASRTEAFAPDRTGARRAARLDPGLLARRSRSLRTAPDLGRPVDDRRRAGALRSRRSRSSSPTGSRHIDAIAGAARLAVAELDAGPLPERQLYAGAVRPGRRGVAPTASPEASPRRRAAAVLRPPGADAARGAARPGRRASAGDLRAGGDGAARTPSAARRWRGRRSSRCSTS